MKTTPKTNATIHICKTASDFLNLLPKQLEEISVKVPDGWHLLKIDKGPAVEFFPELMGIAETVRGLKEAILKNRTSSFSMKEEIIAAANNLRDLKKIADKIKLQTERITTPNYSALQALPSTKKLFNERLITVQFFKDIDSIITGIDFLKGRINDAIIDLSRDYQNNIPQKDYNLLSDFPMAKNYLKRLVPEYLKYDYSLQDKTTLADASIIAYTIAEELGFSCECKYFEKFWGKKGLADANRRVKQRIKKEDTEELLQKMLRKPVQGGSVEVPDTKRIERHLRRY